MPAGLHPAGEAPVEVPVEAKAEAVNDEVRHVTTEDVKPIKRIRDYFTWQPLPWWFCFFIFGYLLVKFQVEYGDSPCAILGTPSPVTERELSKAYRKLSMCTHPDKLKSRLKRTPTSAESLRSEQIFKRASVAKEQLQEKFRGKVAGRKKAESVQCYDGEIEQGLQELLKSCTTSLTELGVLDVWEYLYSFVWAILSLEAGLVSTLFSVLWMAFLFQLLRQFLVYLWRLGILRVILGVTTSVVIGPIPTLLHILLLPIFRCYVFLQTLLQSFVARAPKKEEVECNKKDKETEALAKPELTSEMKAAAARTQELPKGLRQRKKTKETEEEKSKLKEDLLSGEVAGTEETARNDEDAVGKAVVAEQIGERMPEGIWNCLRWTNATPVKARKVAAHAVQFDVLLVLTKPIIPLLFLVAIGQVWNGIFSSLFIGHILRKVPDMSYESHHLLCAFFGSVHTLLGVSSNQVEDFAAREGKNILQLKWEWDYRDHLSVLNMVLLGSTMSASSSLGNEPSYSASFAAGIALRIALAQDSIKGLSLVQDVVGVVERKLAEVGISYGEGETVAAYSGGGIGDCAGGPFRMLFGDGDFFGIGDKAALGAFALKCWLILIPALSTVQWFCRTYYAFHEIRKKGKKKNTVLVQRLILALLGVLQCLLVANLELNASNGALSSFWIAMLFGCVGESLLGTVDIRGSTRAVIVLVLFLLI